MILMRSSDLNQLPPELTPTVFVTEAGTTIPGTNPDHKAPDAAPAFKARVINDHQPSTGIVFTWTPPTGAKKVKKGKFVISKPTMKLILSDVMPIDRFYALLNSDVATGMSSKITYLLNAALEDGVKGLQIYSLEDFKQLVDEFPAVWQIQKSYEIADAITAPPKPKATAKAKEPEIKKTPKQGKKKKVVVLKKGDKDYVEPRARDAMQKDYAPQAQSMKGYIESCKADFKVMYKNILDGVRAGEEFLKKEDDVEFRQKTGIDSSKFSSVESGFNKIQQALGVYLVRLRKEYFEATKAWKQMDTDARNQAQANVSATPKNLGAAVDYSVSDLKGKEVQDTIDTRSPAEKAMDLRKSAAGDAGNWTAGPSEEDMEFVDAHIAGVDPKTHVLSKAARAAFDAQADVIAKAQAADAAAKAAKKTKVPTKESVFFEMVEVKDILEDLGDFKAILWFFWDLSEDGVNEDYYRRLTSFYMGVLANISNKVKAITATIKAVEG